MEPEELTPQQIRGLTAAEIEQMRAAPVMHVPTHKDALQIQGNQPGLIVSSTTRNNYFTGNTFQLKQPSIREVLDVQHEGRRPVFGLDFETYGTRDLTQVGLDNYVRDPKFMPLCAAIAERDEHDNIQTNVYDFVNEPRSKAQFERYMRQGDRGAAHNAPFERAVLNHMGIHTYNLTGLMDTAVVARCLGADSHLEKAAPQLLHEGYVKMPEGKRLIRKWSMPDENGNSRALEMAKAGTLKDDPDWKLFLEYCAVDATLSLLLAENHGYGVPAIEWRFEALTHKMNQVGWRVDLEKVKEMRRRYLENMEAALVNFRELYDPEGKLNFNSPVQLKRWCEERGVKAKSFDEEHVLNLLAKTEARISTMDPSHPRWVDYNEVRVMLETKRTLGGSSLKKLDVILRLTGEDGILRNQYMHAGAGQTYRTSGRGVQMQNLKRLSEVADMDELEDDDVDWDNEQLAANIRQVFTARSRKGSLIVGDFKSVEARGLAYLAEEQWKLEAFRRGDDLYKVGAAKIFHVDVKDVTKSQRQTGKVGELSCGYGAGPDAVTRFASKMGVAISGPEALQLVRDWRSANPSIVALWEKLDDMLKEALTTQSSAYHMLSNGMEVRIQKLGTPSSLLQQHPGAQTLEVVLLDRSGNVYLQRVFQGCYLRGRNVCYYKPGATQNGPLWSSNFIDPKTKQRVFYSIYGGKLAGILTQSFCREIFFRVLRNVAAWCEHTAGLRLIGQFHDELVLDYDPDTCIESLPFVEQKLEGFMSDAIGLSGFPLGADVKHDYRYTK